MKKRSSPVRRAALMALVSSALIFWGAPLRAADRGSAPKPIPGGLGRVEGTPVGYHVYTPGSPTDPTVINEPSLITDLDGVVGLAKLQGTGKATDTRTGLKYPLDYELDMRFMKGRYVGTDGAEHEGIFGFI